MAEGAGLGVVVKTWRLTVHFRARFDVSAEERTGRREESMEKQRENHMYQSLTVTNNL